MSWVWDENRQTETGRLVDGKQIGHWVQRFPNGSLSEGTMVNGERNGHWVWRYPDGYVAEGEGPYLGRQDERQLGHPPTGRNVRGVVVQGWRAGQITPLPLASDPNGRPLGIEWRE